MQIAKVLVLGKFQPEDLVVSVGESNRKINPVVEAKVDEIWEIKKKEAEKLGQICYNGISYRVNYLEQRGDKIHIDFGTIEFKTRMCLMNVPEYLNLPEEYYKKCCFSGATVRTSDGLYVMVELSGKSMNKNKIDLLGGIIEKPLDIKDGDDLFDSILSELKEEACINKQDIKECYLRAIYSTVKTDVGFYFEVTLNISSTEILNRFKLENHDQDIKSINFFKRDEYIKILENFNESKRLISDIMTL